MNNPLASYATPEDSELLSKTDHHSKITTKRSNFERDRDRILHSKAFKRLSQKTQVFIFDGADHHRNRLTHTLEVESISNSISTVLNLNTFLCSAIALGHDLGAPPFGKSGENALNNLTKSFRLSGFRHNHQGIRVVENLEDQYPDYTGLNLTIGVREGILKHKEVDEYALSLHSDELVSFLKSTNLQVPSTLEGQAVRRADDIAQIYHYIEDGLRYELIPLERIWQTALWEKVTQNIESAHGVNFKKFISDATKDITKLTTCRFLIKFMVTSIIRQSKRKIDSIGAENIHPGLIDKIIIDFEDDDSTLIDDFYKKIIAPHIFGYNKIIIMMNKARNMIEQIFDSFNKEPRQLPAKTFKLFHRDEIGDDSNHSLRVIADHIAGMTDRYAIKTFKDLCVNQINDNYLL